MNCPYCNKEMERGTLRSRGGVFFLPDGETVPKFFTEKEMAKHNAVILPPDMLSTKSEFPIAQICRNCSKIVIEY